MGLFGLNIFKRNSDRPTSPLDERWYTPFLFSQPTHSGAVVSPETALTNPYVYSCVKVISETLATMPMVLYQRTGERSKKRATEHAAFFLMKNQPNHRMTAMEFKEMLTGHYLLRGNAYAQIIYTNDGKIHSLWPLHPARMEVIPDPREGAEIGAVVYLYKTGGQTVRFEQNEIMHIKGSSDGGLVGRTPIDCFREAIGMGLSMDQYLANFYGNSASPSGILTLPVGQSLSGKAKDRLREDWQKKFSGSYRAGNIAVLEDGVTWQQVGMTSTDAQFIETEKVTALKIAGVFRVQPHKIGLMDSAKLNNVEQQNIEFYTDTMLPHLERWCQVAERDLLRKDKRGKFLFEFVVNSVLRGDILTRYRAYAIGRQWGWLSVNDIRGFENENEVEGGDVYLQPLNMIEASKAMDYLLTKKEGGSEEDEPDVKLDGEDPSDPTLKNSLIAAIEARENPLVAALERRNAEILHELRLQKERGADMMVELRLQKEYIENRLKMAENREIPAQINEISLKTDQKPSDPMLASFGSVRAAGIEMFSETIGRFIRKESEARQRAEKKGKADTFREEFLPKQKEQLSESLLPQVRFYLEQVRYSARDSGRDVLPEKEVSERAERLSRQFAEWYGLEGTVDVGDPEMARSLAQCLVHGIEDAAAPEKREHVTAEGKVVEKKPVLVRQRVTIEKDAQGNKVYYLDPEPVKEAITGD